MKKVFTTGDVSRICHVTINTVVKWFDMGELRGYCIPGSGARRVPRKDLIKFMQKYNFPMDELAADKLKILTVDDNPKVHSLFRKVFSDKEKYLLQKASSGFEAGLQAGEFTPDIIFLNIRLKDIDAKKVCKILRQNGDTADTRVVAMSGAVGEKRKKELKRQGFADFVRKPLRPEHLLETVNRLSS